MLTENDFPRWVHKAGKQTLLVGSLEEYEKALGSGWYSTVVGVAEVKQEPTTGETVAAANYVDDAPDDETLPTREELETKAKELGVKFNAQLGDKRLAALIQEKLGA